MIENGSYVIYVDHTFVYTLRECISGVMNGSLRP